MGKVPSVLEGLQQLPVSEVKKRGWKGVMRLVGDKGPLVVTNHDQPDAVVVPIGEYVRLRDLARKKAANLDTSEATVRAEWQRRMAWLREPGSDDFLRSLVNGPSTLQGDVKAGEGW